MKERDFEALEPYLPGLKKEMPDSYRKTGRNYQVPGSGSVLEKIVRMERNKPVFPI